MLSLCAAVGGVPIVKVTSVGGPAITLATTSGMVTSFVGHSWTIDTASCVAPLYSPACH